MRRLLLKATAGVAALVLLSIEAFLRLDEARNWRDFPAAMRVFVVPPQNFVYADVKGPSSRIADC